MTTDFIANGSFNDLFLFPKFLVVLALMRILPEIPSQRRYIYIKVYSNYQVIGLSAVLLLLMCRKWFSDLRGIILSSTPTLLSKNYSFRDAKMQKLHSARHKNKIEEKETQCSYHTTGGASVNKGTTMVHTREKNRPVISHRIFRIFMIERLKGKRIK